MVDNSDKGSTMGTVKQAKKTKVPPPWRKLSPAEARALANKKFAKALSMLAK